MHRLTARLLLLLALIGYLAPIAIASSAPARACCVRKGVHHCDDALGSETEQPVIRDASCCKGDCGRAVTTAQWAHAREFASASVLQNVEAHLGRSTLASPNNELSRSQSTRAPPTC